MAGSGSAREPGIPCWARKLKIDKSVVEAGALVYSKKCELVTVDSQCPWREWKLVNMGPCPGAVRIKHSKRGT